MQNDSPKLKRLEASQLLNESSGLRNLPWKPQTHNSLAPDVLDMEWLTADPLLPFLVPVIPAQVLYQSMQHYGVEESKEVVEWIRGHQLHQILDYDLWQKKPDLATEVIVAERAFQWFRMWLEIGPEFLAERVFELEEDLCVSLFASLFEILPEGVSANKDDLTDDYFTTPDNRFHLKLKDSGNNDHFEIAHLVVRYLYGKDARQASQTFAYSAMLITQECLENELRWRKGRMADSGFVEVEEAMLLLKPRTQTELAKIVSERLRIQTSSKENEALRLKKFSKTQAAFLADIEPEIFDAIVNLMRSFEPQVSGAYIQHFLSAHEIARLSGTSAAVSEDLVEDGEVLLEAAEKAVAVARAKLSQRNAAPAPIEKSDVAELLLIEKAMAVIATQDPEIVLDQKQRFARLGNTLASALSPNDSVSNEVLARTLEILKGVLNVGLQLCLLKPADLGLVPFEDLDFEEVRGASLLKLLGPEVLFQIGWQKISDLSLTILDKFEFIYQADPVLFSYLKPTTQVKLPDSAVVEVEVKRLAQSGRMADVRKWVQGFEEYVPAPTYWVVSALLNRIPMYPEAFEANTRSLKPFSTLSEILVATNFIDQLQANLSSEK